MILFFMPKILTHIFNPMVIALPMSIAAFEVTGDHFKDTFKITSVTVHEDGTSFNAESDSAGQYGKVYLTYNLKSSDNSRNSGTWLGYGRGISPEGNLAVGNLMGVWTRDGSMISIKSLDEVTDGINYMQGTMNLISGEIKVEVYKVD
jgi:hypothetical protein